MTARTRRRSIAHRIALISLVGLVAVVFLSSSFVAGIIAVVTIAAVLVDSIAFARLRSADRRDGDAPPQTITVDLSRRS
jgi:energy-coupling factor transporter transmembrane protein EcfT